MRRIPPDPEAKPPKRPITLQGISKPKDSPKPQVILTKGGNLNATSSVAINTELLPEVKTNAVPVCRSNILKKSFTRRIPPDSKPKPQVILTKGGNATPSIAYIYTEPSKLKTGQLGKTYMKVKKPESINKLYAKTQSESVEPPKVSLQIKAGENVKTYLKIKKPDSINQLHTKTQTESDQLPTESIPKGNTDRNAGTSGKFVTFQRIPKPFLKVNIPSNVDSQQNIKSPTESSPKVDTPINVDSCQQSPTPTESIPKDPLHIDDQQNIDSPTDSNPKVDISINVDSCQKVTIQSRSPADPALNYKITKNIEQKKNVILPLPTELIPKVNGKPTVLRDLHKVVFPKELLPKIVPEPVVKDAQNDAKDSSNTGQKSNEKEPTDPLHIPNITLPIHLVASEEISSDTPTEENTPPNASANIKNSQILNGKMSFNNFLSDKIRMPSNCNISFTANKNQLKVGRLLTAEEISSIKLDQVVLDTNEGVKVLRKVPLGSFLSGTNKVPFQSAMNKMTNKNNITTAPVKIAPLVNFASKTNTILQPQKVPCTNYNNNQNKCNNNQNKSEDPEYQRLQKELVAADKKNSEMKKSLQSANNKLRCAKKALMSLRARVKKSKVEFFDKLTKKMNPITKKVFASQIKLAASKKGKGRRFTDEDKLLALALYKQGAKAYRFLKMIFVLPSKTTLVQYVRELQKKNLISQDEVGLGQPLKDANKNCANNENCTENTGNENCVEPTENYSTERSEHEISMERSEHEISMENVTENVVHSLDRSLTDDGIFIDRPVTYEFADLERSMTEIAMANFERSMENGDRSVIGSVDRLKGFGSSDRTGKGFGISDRSKKGFGGPERSMSGKRFSGLDRSLSGKWTSSSERSEKGTGSVDRSKGIGGPERSMSGKWTSSSEKGIGSKRTMPMKGFDSPTRSKYVKTISYIGRSMPDLGETEEACASITENVENEETVGEISEGGNFRSLREYDRGSYSEYGGSDAVKSLNDYVKFRRRL